MWNYRLVRRRIQRKFSSEMFYAVHEAYYDDNKKVWAITKEPTSARGNTREEVLRALAMMMNDILRAPVLDYNKVPEKGAKGPDEKGRKRVRGKANRR